MDVCRILDPIWTEKYETALKIKLRLQVIFERARFLKLRDDNPVDHVEKAMPKTENLKGHFKTIHYSEVPEALKTIRQAKAYPTTKAACEFLIMTATRSQEVRLATWDEINLDEKTWTIPEAHTKTNREYQIPLSSRCLEILEEVKQYRQEINNLIFPSIRGKVLSDSTLSKMVRESGIDAVPHALARATFRTWAADKNVVREVAESCLAHTLGKVEAAYQRSDLFEQRRRVMQKWADYLMQTAPAKVVNLR